MGVWPLGTDFHVPCSSLCTIQYSHCREQRPGTTAWCQSFSSSCASFCGVVQRQGLNVRSLAKPKAASLLLCLRNWRRGLNALMKRQMAMPLVSEACVMKLAWHGFRLRRFGDCFEAAVMWAGKE